MSSGLFQEALKSDPQNGTVFQDNRVSVDCGKMQDSSLLSGNTLTQQLASELKKMFPASSGGN